MAEGRWMPDVGWNEAVETWRALVRLQIRHGLLQLVKVLLGFPVLLLQLL